MVHMIDMHVSRDCEGGSDHGRPPVTCNVCYVGATKDWPEARAQCMQEYYVCEKTERRQSM